MSGRRFSTEEYAGARVLFPTGIADRLVDVARAELAAQLRFVDDDEDPALVLQRWLDGKQTIPMPGPHAEPGDLLVKVGRAETWTFTVHGWRELAPIELQTDPAGTGEPAAYAETDRYWGKSVVEDELDRLRAEKNAPTAAADPVPREARAALDELQQHVEYLERVADALATGRDGGNDSPLFEAITQTRTFSRALEYARTIIWKHATRQQGSS